MIKLENKENGRYYYLHVETDIFGDLTLIVMRGGINRHIRPHMVMAGKMEAIDQKIKELIRRRISRGYTSVN